MELARSEARGCPRKAKFDPEIGGSLLAKKVAKGVKRGKKLLDLAKDCGLVPKDQESEERKIA
jgi:hypothetical protein